MSRPARAYIDLDALSRNYRKLKSLHGGRTLAVLKADAYGHGATPCARALEADADGFAVAFAQEAIELRDAGIRRPILILEGAFSPAELQVCQTEDLWIVVHHEEQVRMLETCGFPERSLGVWLKIDTGMNRAGFRSVLARHIYRRLSICPAVHSIVLMTHLACADDMSSDVTLQQVSAFEEATDDLPGLRSLCNSAGILGWAQARRDWGRCGIAMYGAGPLPDARTDLDPVMTLQSEVFAVKDVQAGEFVGYAASFVADRPMRVGLVAMGYADGFPRSAGTGTPVLVEGQAARIIGRVSMDMITIDLTDVPRAGIGSKVEFWGRGIDINEIASHAGTIAYEILCNVKRVRKVYSPTAWPTEASPERTSLRPGTEDPSQQHQPNVDPS